ncbi:MAG: hypothetical protein WD749_02405 [Phycisphaerales bacterium]
MRKAVGAAVATVLAAGAAVSGAPIFHFDVNGLTVQARDASGASGTFGGLSHTGSLSFGFQGGVSQIAAIGIQETIGGASQNQNFTGVLTSFTGTVNMVNGRITGGTFRITAGEDFYQADIVPQVGAVSNYVGGGYKLDGLTFNGQFGDSQFVNVDVSPWFNMQHLAGGLFGSFLQFNWAPNASGFSYADMDVFVDVIPLPPAAWTGMATLAGIGLIGYIRRRR